MELDALPVEELRGRIRTNIEEHMDMEALEESKRIEAEEQIRLREGLEHIFEGE